MDKSEIKTIDIYETYTNLWIKREDWRSFMTASQKKSLMEELALEMWIVESKQYITHRDLQRILKKYYSRREYKTTSFASFEQDIRTCSFLLHDGKGKYRFAHRSFYEYFVASVIAREINIRQPKFLKVKLPSHEILFFISQMIIDVENLIDLILSTRGEDFKSTGYMASTCTTVAIMLDNNLLRGRDLSYTILPQVDFTGANLTGTNFRGANLENALFAQVSLNDADFRGSNLEGAEFLDASSVRTASFSRDGRMIASAGTNGIIIIWDVVTGREFLTLRGSPSIVYSVDWSPDNSKLASSSDDGTINIWKLDALHPSRSLKGHYGPIYDVRWNHTGKLLATSGEDGKIIVWDAASWEILHILEGHDGGVLKVDWSLDGKWLVSAGIDRTVRVWNMLKMQIETVLSHHHDYVRCVKWSPDGGSFASCSDDGTIRLWSANNWELISSIGGTKVPILSIAWHPEGRLLAGGLRDDTIRFWRFPDERELKSVKEHVGRVWSVTWSPDGKILASAGNEGCIKTWYASIIKAENGNLEIDRNFGVNMNSFETRLSCVGAKIANVTGINRKGYQIVRNKDRPWEVRDGTLQEWLLARGAVEE